MADAIEILREDLSQTLSFIDKCDDHMFKVKNWALVTTSAVIAFAIARDRDYLPLANIAFCFAFIYLELMYKSFQDSAIDHSRELSKRIDSYLAGSEKKEILDGYKHGFGRTLEYPSLMRVFSLLGDRHRWHILTFYLLLSGFSIGAILIAEYVA